MAEDTMIGTGLPENQSEPQIYQFEGNQYEEAFGEPLSRTLDPSAWHEGADLYALYARTEQEIFNASTQEDSVRRTVREYIFRKLKDRPNAPKNAGVWRADLKDIERVHRGLLFNGGVEVAVGTSLHHESLPLSITQLAVCLTSYDGSQGAWSQRMYRRDLRIRGIDPVNEVLDLLERRDRSSSGDLSGERDSLSRLARRGIMDYMERAILMEKSKAKWRMGHGNPAPVELIRLGFPEFIGKSLDLLDHMLGKHRRVVFVPSAPVSRMWLTIGNALGPVEFAIVDTLEPQMDRLISQGHYRGDLAKYIGRLREFQHDVSSKIVMGAYRVWEHAPPYLFYAHEDHAFTAALIVMADSMLQRHIGFPMLIDLAREACRTQFGSDTLGAAVQSAYISAGMPMRYMEERESRR